MLGQIDLMNNSRVENWRFPFDNAEIIRGQAGILKEVLSDLGQPTSFKILDPRKSRLDQATLKSKIKL